MTSPIMSRFDLFFVIVDECDEITDYNIARHITNMHQRLDEAVVAEFSTEDVREAGKAQGFSVGLTQCSLPFPPAAAALHQVCAGTQAQDYRSGQGGHDHRVPQAARGRYEYVEGERV